MGGVDALIGPPAPSHAAYSTIVEGDGDLVGLVAYSLYKSDKLACLARHLKDVGRAPSNDEVMAFCRTSTLPGPVSAHRSKTAYLLSDMYDELLDGQVSEIDEKYKAEMLAELKKAHPFWQGVLQHAAAGVVVWAFVGLTILVLYGQQIGCKQLATNLLGLDKKAAVEQPAGR